MIRQTTAGRSPLSDMWPVFMLIGGLVLLFVPPQLSAAAWSSTDWRPASKLSEFVAGYQHMFVPERIVGSGLSGIRFGATVVAIDVSVLLVVVIVGGRSGRRRRVSMRGLAHGSELDRFSADSIVSASKVILGAHDNNPQRAGICVGRCAFSKREIWLPKESTILVLAPPRAGKTSKTVAPAVVNHHGPVVATGVRHDIMEWTHPMRRKAGAPMWLCEPMLPVGTALPEGVKEVRWNPVVGCESQVTARLRAEALFAAIPKGGANDEFWRNAGQMLLAGYLMAAACKGGTMRDVLNWVDQDGDRSPVTTLRAAANDADDEMTRDSLDGMAAQIAAAIAQDPRYKAGVTGQVMGAVDPFRMPEIRRMCEVPAEESLDLRRFLTESATVWMLGSESHQKQAAGVCTALTAALVEEARLLARLDGGRLRPPLLLALDEAVNVAPIPRLEQLLSTGGGSGIQTIVVLQSLAAARNVWGREMGDALLDFNNAKIVLGGLSDAQDLADLSTLLGQRDERVVQASRSGRAAVFESNDYQYSWRQVPVMRPDEIREIDSEREGHALLIARSTRGVLMKQTAIFDQLKVAQR